MKASNGKPTHGTCSVDNRNTNVPSPPTTQWILPLCISHAAAAWGERSWEFGAGLLLLYLNDEENLRLTALLVLTASLTCAICGSRIGGWVGSSTYLKGAVVTLALQNFGICLAAVSCVLAFEYKPLAALAIFFSVVARLGSLGSTIATEKKWATALSLASEAARYGPLDSREEEEEESTAVMVNGHEDNGEAEHYHDGTGVASQKEEREEEVDSESSLHAKQNDKSKGSDSRILSRVNARLRCIDLFCNLMAPMAVGFLLEYTTPMGAAIAIAVFNLIAWPVEVACLLWIHARYQHALVVPIEEAECDEQPQQRHDIVRCSACKTYFRQSIVRSAFAMAVLYLTVVSLGTLMTAWLVSLGFSEAYVGIARALAAASGMGATQVVPYATGKYGIEAAASRFIWFMWICILPCAVAAPLATWQPGLLWVVVVAVILSRFGLWGFDLCVTQLLQERIEPKEEIGSVNGTQAAIHNAFDALAALSCVLVPDPEQFAFLILGSFGSVTVAALLHTSALLKRQNTTSS